MTQTPLAESNSSNPCALPERPHFQFWPKRMPRTLTLPETSLWQNLAVSALRYPHRPAYRYFGHDLSFAQLKTDSESIAAWLQTTATVTKGERVLLYMQNAPQFAQATYGIFRADCVMVPVNPMNRAEEFAHYISNADARVVICSADLAETVLAANATMSAELRLKHILITHYTDALPKDAAVLATCVASIPASMLTWITAQHPAPVLSVENADVCLHTWAEALAFSASHKSYPKPHIAQPDDLAVMPYTSGTTGFPKGCMHTHRTVMHNVVGGAVWGQSGADSVTLGVVPMFHVTGMMYGVFCPIYTGSCVVILPRWDREAAGRMISTSGVTHWACIPTMIIDLFGSPNVASFDLSSLKYISGGGAAMPQAVAQKLKDQFDLTFIEGYGLSETIAPSHGNPPDRAKQQCLGIPSFGVDARVVDPATLKEVAVGDMGEIVIHGPQVFKGYWKAETATAEAFFELDGKSYFRSGDLGYMDAEGYFFLTDRLKRMINASGFKVWPAEVESLLYKHPAVQEACIIASLDAYRGETVKAVIVLRADAANTTIEDIITWSKAHMAAYKYPRIVEFVAALPKSGAGKVLWRVLQEAENKKP